MKDLLAEARSWIEGDPDPGTRRGLQILVDGDDQEGLLRAMGEPLTFGTAGIRGEVGPGSGRMNRATVIRTTRGLVDYLLKKHLGAPDDPVVIGFDARPDSRTFAEDAAGVIAAAGIRARYFPGVIPTPLVAFAAKHLGAPAAVVITASHNPPADNGYKVYDSNAAQIIPPTDVGIAAAIEEVGPARDVPRIESVFAGNSDLVSPVPEDIVDDYWQELNETRPDPRSSDLAIVYTPLHGVGGATVLRMFDRAGHTGLIPVPEQLEPDGTFPTVAFPNPEEPGALDLALQLAKDADADLVLANDPDADRLAAAVPSSGEWRLLSGNELGALLGDYVLRNWPHTQPPIVVNSVVSSPMMGRIAAKRGAVHEVSLTGFKWIINAGLALEERGVGRFAFGYEEALGYSVGRTVRDKDGISAAVVMADLAAGEAASGRGVIDRLHEIWDEVGLWVSAQHSIVRTGAEGRKALLVAVDRVGERPPSQLLGSGVTEVTDYRLGGEERPPWLGAQDLVELTLGEEGRILVRPSGTEPKLKIYVDLSGATTPDHATAHARLLARAQDLAVAVGEWLEV
ncbi:MAG TPA: phospho-sugar mutase [Acidimicrobiia bacterium]|nr:phospho-sugar mutase [Acidimicrobiia bacterium]